MLASQGAVAGEMLWLESRSLGRPNAYKLHVAMLMQMVGHVECKQVVRAHENVWSGAIFHIGNYRS